MEKIMDKISKKAVDTYRVASKQAGKLAKEIKLKAQMSENKNKIQELYEDIGKTVYEKYVLKKDINVDRDLLNNCYMIDVLADENEDIRMELLKLKDLKQCPKCHYEIYYDFHFCPNCGYVQDEAEKKDCSCANSENNENEKDANNEVKPEKQNDGPATIVTTDAEDTNLKQHIDSFPTEETSEYLEEDFSNNAEDD